MSKIKTKDIIKGTIKIIDKSAIAVERTKDTIVNVKEKSENAYNGDVGVNEYIEQKISHSSNRLLDESISKFTIKGKQSVIDTKNNIIKSKQKLKTFKLKLAEKRNNVNVSKGIKTSKQAIKSTTKTINNVVKVSERTKKLAQETIRKTAIGIKSVIKVSISTVKTAIAGTKALIAVLLAGGWIALIIIIIICLIGLLCSSDFGIFFSSEKTNSNSITMDKVINEIEIELFNKIEIIKNNNEYDEYRINYNPSKWQEVLIIYTVKVSDDKDIDVMTLNDEKIDLLKNVYWNMNSVNYQILSENEKNILQIDVSSKTLEIIMNMYNFNTEQRKRVQELLSNKYSNLWSSVILGIDKNKFSCPVLSNFYITSLYSNEHQAIDVYTFYGDNIYSIYDGIVIIAKGGCIIGDLNCNGKAGNYVVIEHNGTEYFSSYMHLDRVNVSVGDKIDKGDIIGTMGNTGNVIPAPIDVNSKLGTHLHFVLYKGKNYNNSIPVNPTMLFIK